MSENLGTLRYTGILIKFLLFSDGKPPLVSVTTVRVDVDDTNDLSPWFLYTPYSGTVRENEIAVVTKVQLDN